jgi:hypothetical protein
MNRSKSIDFLLENTGAVIQYRQHLERIAYERLHC